MTTTVTEATRADRLDELSNTTDLDRAAELVEFFPNQTAGRIQVTLADTGEVLAASTSIPEVDAARALLERGKSGAMITTWAGSRVVAVRIPDIAALAAKYDRGDRQANSD